MAVTLNEMATAYITSIETQLEQAKQQVSQAQAYVQQLEDHLNDCRMELKEPQRATNDDFVGSAVENPFVNQQTTN